MAIFASGLIGRPAAASLDCAFLAVLAALVAREAIAGRNWRNLKVVGFVLAIALANLAFHVEDARAGAAEYSQRGALGLIVMPILPIGGRVTPSFTHNWLARAGVAVRPVPFGRLDGAAMALLPTLELTLLYIAAAAWILAFAAFLAGYAPLLARRTGG